MKLFILLLYLIKCFFCINITRVSRNSNTSLPTITGDKYFYLTNSEYTKYSSYIYFVLEDYKYNLKYFEVSKCHTNIDPYDYPDSAFKNCKRLKEVLIPDGVEKIGDWAFSNCENLVRVSLPKDLKVIGNNAFWGSNLKYFVLPKNIEKIGTGSFGNTYSRIKVFVSQYSRHSEIFLLSKILKNNFRFLSSIEHLCKHGFPFFAICKGTGVYNFEFSLT